MNPIKRFARYVRHDVWRPDEPRVWVRKNKPGIGWTVNLAAARRRLRRLGR
jgi:hypothetical protein